tara:strand:+ start:790 stop:1197 length:408 start_codon:yes stop_codon:yes gene_type:complete
MGRILKELLVQFSISIFTALFLSTFLYGCSSSPQENIPYSYPHAVRIILINNVPEFRTCYSNELNSNHNYKGLVKLIFTIGSEGRVSKANVTNDNGMSKELKSCLVEKLAQIRFPKPDKRGVVKVIQPMNFYPIQ